MGLLRLFTFLKLLALPTAQRLGRFQYQGAEQVSFSGWLPVITRHLKSLLGQRTEETVLESSIVTCKEPCEPVGFRPDRDSVPCWCREQQLLPSGALVPPRSGSVLLVVRSGEEPGVFVHMQMVP